MFKNYFNIALRNLIRNKGYSIINIDSNIIAQAPKLNPHIDPMRCRLSEALDLSIEAVSIKAKTSEHVGPEGREESISTQAIVLIQSHA